MRLLLFLLLTPFVAAQTTPVWFKVVPENGTATLPAGTTYQYGATGKFCDAVKVTVSTTVTASNTSVACKVNGVVTADPDPNVVKELDVQEQAASFVVATVINGTKGSVTVPALPVVTPPGPQTIATVPAPDSASRLFWCDITNPTFQCIPARTDGK